MSPRMVAILSVIFCITAVLAFVEDASALLRWIETVSGAGACYSFTAIWAVFFLFMARQWNRHDAHVRSQGRSRSSNSR